MSLSKLDLFPLLLLYSYSFLSSYLGSATEYKADGKENIKDEGEGVEGT